MKKYTNKHLENVPPEFIVGLEDVIQYDTPGCPAAAGNMSQICGNGENAICAMYFIYKPFKRDCPCCEFGESQFKKMAVNIITQWKKLMGVED